MVLWRLPSTGIRRKLGSSLLSAQSQFFEKNLREVEDFKKSGSFGLFGLIAPWNKS